ncbi:MAG: hypothetical protein WDZ30_08020 [Cellvibrionaceae bacterium]
MRQMLNKTNYLFQRELWEHRGGVIWTPVVIGAVAMMLTVLSLVFGVGDELNQHLDQVAEWAGGQRTADANEPTFRIDFSRGELVPAEDDDLDWALWGSQLLGLLTPTLHGIGIVFGIVAFIVSVFYLLGSLFNDRKDRTILFWKSLPFSETHSVLVKLAFASLAIPLSALVVALVVQIFFAGMTVSLIAVNTDFSLGGIISEVSVLPVFITHLLLVFIFAVKNLVLASWLLFCSALSRRSPFLTALVPPIAVVALERLVFGSSYIGVFLASLSMDVEYEITAWSTTSAVDLLRSFVTVTPMQFLKIVIVSGALLWGTIWLRNRRYEL